MLNLFATAAATPDLSGLTNVVTTDAIYGIIQTVLPIVGTAILVGCVFYVIRWAIGLFRGV